MTDPIQSELSDHELIGKIAARDTAALRMLNARYARMLTALAWRFLRSEEDAEEIAADVLWQVWREAGNFDPNRGTPAVWLITIARSRCLDRLRAIKARSKTMAADDPEPVPEPTAQLERGRRSQVVRTVLAGLQRSERDTLELAYFSELSQTEIAARLGVPLGTVKTRIRSALTRMRQALAGRDV